MSRNDEMDETCKRAPLLVSNMRTEPIGNELIETELNSVLLNVHDSPSSRNL